jgi:hypothetical protein
VLHQPQDQELGVDLKNLEDIKKLNVLEDIKKVDVLENTEN